MIEIEGYAALFGVADHAGDIVRAGAFRESLARRSGPLPMFVHHEQRLLAGVWSDVREDARGLFVRGRIEPYQPGAARARQFLNAGKDGLSIGFIAHVAEKRVGPGRLLIELELIEVSLVDQPMQPLARLRTRALSRAA